jgi:uncharacterized membrane protein
MTSLDANPQTSFRRLAAASFWLGFALSGFFDGILLHQILQWHHLLSGLAGQGGLFADLRVQVLADGYFHLLMYVIAALGLWLLWRARASFGCQGSVRVLLGWLLIGFGVWHFADAIASHWITGIHRIRMDVENPLPWDLGWLAVFGLVPLAAGLVICFRGERARGGRPTGRGALALLAAVAVGSGVWAAQRPPGEQYATIVFAPAVTFARGFSLAQETGKVVWFNGDGVFVVKGQAAGWRLYGHGALLVVGAGGPGGCMAWSRV